MSNVAWPASLPQFVLQDGFQEQLPKGGMETTMEAGPAKTRRRFTTNWRQLTFTMKLLIDQKLTFDDFWVNTLAMGTLPFDWVDPFTRQAATFRFHPSDPPTFGAEGEAMVMTAKMERML